MDVVHHEQSGAEYIRSSFPGLDHFPLGRGGNCCSSIWPCWKNIGDRPAPLGRHEKYDESRILVGYGTAYSRVRKYRTDVGTKIFEINEI